MARACMKIDLHGPVDVFRYTLDHLVNSPSEKGIKWTLETLGCQGSDPDLRVSDAQATAELAQIDRVVQPAIGIT